MFLLLKNDNSKLKDELFHIKFSKENQNKDFLQVILLVFNIAEGLLFERILKDSSCFDISRPNHSACLDATKIICY